MVTTSVADAKALMAEHILAIREYAYRALKCEEPLTPSEELDRARRLDEVWTIGTGFQLTEVELVDLVYKDLFVVKWGCKCPSCRERLASHGIEEL